MEDQDELEVILVTEMTDAAVHWPEIAEKLSGGAHAVLYSKAFLPLGELAALPHVACSVTITGWGGTWLEPNVQPPELLVGWLNDAVTMLGDRVRLRIDPVVPSAEGLDRACAVARCIKAPIRTTVSVLQFYKGMEVTFRRLGLDPGIFTVKSGRAWFPNQKVAETVYQMLKAVNPDLSYQFCGMPYEVGDTHTGCVDEDLLAAIGVTKFKRVRPGFQRPGCKCVIKKLQLVSGACPHGCQYCYARHGRKP